MGRPLLIRSLALSLLLALFACNPVLLGEDTGSGGADGGTTTSSSGAGAAGPCDVDCSKLQPPECMVAVCNAALGTCIMDPVADGTSCNDHDACTQNDTCMAGVCSGSPVAGCTLYSTSWEGTCPDGWTLTGDWQCGVPTNHNTSAPTAAYDGTQCISTGLTQDYSNNDTYAGTTATSPQIDLTTAQSPTLTFHMWVDTEGTTFDGFNLQVSTDDGMTFSVVPATAITMSPYTLTIAGEPAWGGHQAALGWQLVEVNLSAYAGELVNLRFAFRSDASDTYAGVFIDDFLVE